MRFFGAEESLESWKEIIKTRLKGDCSEIVSVDDRCQFDVVLTKEEVDVLYNEYWYEKADRAEFPWNWRITFSNT